MNGQEPVPLSQECIFWRFTSLKQGIMGKFSPPDLASRDLESGSKGSLCLRGVQEGRSPLELLF